MFAGLSGALLAIAVFFLVFIILFPQIQNQACSNNPLVTQPAVQLSNALRNYPPINGTDCSSLLELVTNANLMIGDMNGLLGTNFNQTSVDNACSYGIQIAPLLGTYNDVILSARSINPNNATSVTSFYEKIFLLAADFFIVNSAIDEISYRTAFRTTGELNDGLKLGKLTELCGDACYSEVLSQIHWFIRDNFNGMLNDFLSWAGTKLEPNSCGS